MKKIILITLIIAVIAGLIIIIFIFNQKQPELLSAPASNNSPVVNIKGRQDQNQSINPMKILSSAFVNQSRIPTKYSCDGQNINPPLSFDSVPAGVVSLVLIVDDPDAPGGIWTHWTVWNINPSINEIAENSVPSGAVQGQTSFGKTGYGGPCPPAGTHRYFFKLFALDVKIDLAASADVQQLQEAIKNHIVASAELVGLNSR